MRHEFLGLLDLFDSLAPKLGARATYSCAVAKLRLFTTLVEHIVPHNHARLVHKRHVTHSPRLAPNLGVNLDENFVADRAQVLAARDGVGEDHL